MPISRQPITNFTSGQFDPRLYGREDIEQYSGGAKELTNTIVEWYGGATRTPGTKFVNEVKTSAKKTRLIPFIFSNVQAYIIELGDAYVRFYKDGAQIESGGSPYEIVSPYGEDDLFDVQYVQTADLLYMVHPDYPPKQLIRSGDTSWAISDIAFEKGPLLDLNTTATTITPSAATGTGITLTASAALFNADHVGSIWKINNGWVEIKTYSSTTSVTADVLYGISIGGTSAYTDWQEGAWSDYRGYPSCVTFYEDRATFAATDNQPNTVWLSEPGAFEQFEGGADDGDAITVTHNSRKINRIKWLDSGTFLALGNEGGIVRVWSGSDAQPITPSNISAKQILSEGASGVAPLQISSVTHYVQRDGTTVRALQYSLQGDNYFAGDVTALSRSLVDTSIVDMAYQQSPHSVIFYVTSGGKLLTSTIDINQKITAFTEQDDTGSYESVASIPVSGYDEIWFIVNREIDGSDVRYIERLMPYNETTQEDLFYVRCGITYDGSATTTITGLDHLEGETVSILADGYVQPDKTVENGQITLDREASVVHVGLSYSSAVETLNINAGAATGGATTKKRHINKVWVKFYNTIGGELGRAGYMDTITGPKPASIFTGTKEVVFPVGWKDDMTVRIEQNQPLPMTVSAIFPNMITND